MSSEPRQSLTIPDFTGGWNTRDPQHKVRDNQLVDGSQNVNIQVGKIGVRGGYTAVGTPTGSDSCTGIYQGVNGLYTVFSDGDVDTLSGTTYTNRGAGVMANALVSFTSMDDGSGTGLDIYADGTNVRSFDGTTEQALAGSPPAYPYLEVFANHVFLLDDGSATLRFSAQENAESWPASNVIQVDKSSFKGRGLFATQDRLVCFKQQSIHHIIGFDILSFERIAISHGVGCASNQSIEVIENSPNPQWNGMYWVDQGGIYFSPDLGATTIRISDPIQPTFDALDQTALNVSVSGNRRDRDELWFSVRSSGGSTNDRVLPWNYKLGTWHPIYTGMAFRAMGKVDVSSTFKLYAGEATATRKIYDTTSGTSDNGTAISFKAKTKRFFFTDKYEQQKKVRKFSTLHTKIAGQNLTVNPRWDFNTTDDTAGTISMAAESGEVWFNQTVKAAQFEMVQETKDVATEIHTVDIEYEPKDLD